MNRNTIFLFGEAERGEYCKPVYCTSLPQLLDICGHPPEDSEGIGYAVQALLNEQPLVFFRVEQEGFSTADYLQGLKLLYKHQLEYPLSALCMPGVGDTMIIDAAVPICTLHRLILILTEKDMYDYLTVK